MFVASVLAGHIDLYISTIATGDRQPGDTVRARRRLRSVSTIDGAAALTRRLDRKRDLRAGDRVALVLCEHAQRRHRAGIDHARLGLWLHEIERRGRTGLRRWS